MVALKGVQGFLFPAGVIVVSPISHPLSFSLEGVNSYNLPNREKLQIRIQSYSIFPLKKTDK
jgi:hypothetical protein